MSMEVSVTGQVGAPAVVAYGVLSNYTRHHPHILPASFTDLTVEEGGKGDGTVIAVEIKVFGQKQNMRMRVDEPEPGRVLRETDVDDGTVTTFTVEAAGDDSCTVTIATSWKPATGMAAIIDRGVKPAYMRRLYRQELDKLDEYARGLSQADVA